MAVGIIKILLSVIFSNILRLFKFIPNNDPIMGLMLPFAKQRNVLAAVGFPIITMISFDIITMSLGLWTVVTSATYGLLGLFFYLFYRQRGEEKIGLKTYVGSGIVGVLIFDFITGVIAMPIMFGYSFEQAFIGQIPFTLYHLATVTGYVILIAPLVDRHLLMNPKLEDSKITSLFSFLKAKLV